MLISNVTQKSDDWHFLRKGKITGTRLKNIVGTPLKRKDELYSYLGERLATGLNAKDENPLDRGNRLEPEARSMYEFQTNIKIREFGMFISDDSSFIAISPDGATEDFTHQIEIKCPEIKNYMKYWIENKIPEEYYAQVIQAFIVNEKLETMDFVVYAPEIASHPLHIISVNRKELEKDIEEYRDSEISFLKEAEEKLKTLISL